MDEGRGGGRPYFEGSLSSRLFIRSVEVLKRPSLLESLFFCSTDGAGDEYQNGLLRFTR